MSTAREETARLADLLRREHHLMAEFLVALSAFDAERRWEELGYPSLFDFLRRELKLSAGAAQYRKTAAALVRRYPEVEAALRSGDLCLSSVVQVAKVLTADNVREVLPLFSGKSSRDAEFVAASLRPVENPPRREFIVTPVRATPNSAPADGVTDGVFRAPEVPLGAGTTVQPAALAAAIAAPPAALPEPPSPPIPERARIKPLDAERARVNMTVSRRLLEKLAAARDALSHSHPGASEESILELGLDLIIDRHRKRRGIGAKPRNSATASAGGSLATATGPSTANLTASAVPIRTATPTPTPTSPATSTASATLPSTRSRRPPAPNRSRHVPAHVWREVYRRDQGRCAWPLEGGGVCGSTHRVQLDHIDGWALGADTTSDRCRLLCAHHNDRHARALYGDDVMDRYTRPKGPACSEPIASYRSAARTGEGRRARGVTARPRGVSRREALPLTAASRGGERQVEVARPMPWRRRAETASGPPRGISMTEG